jgi:hypothetical protein
MMQLVQEWEAPEIKKCQKIDQKFPFWSHVKIAL